MARFNVRRNEMMGDLAKDLDIPFKRNGAMVVCIHESEKDGSQGPLATEESQTALRN